MDKYDYIPGFCKQYGYNGLWSVQYSGKPGNYKKVKMACSCRKDNCDAECAVLQDAPETYPQAQEWLLRDEL